MKQLLSDMEKFIAYKGLGNILSTKEGQDFIKNYLTLKEMGDTVST
jgi:hypothetical protein